MRLLRRNDYPDGKFTLAFVGYQDEKDGAVLELTHNWGVAKYELGSGYGHIAIEVDDAYQACEMVRKKGGSVIREAGVMQHGKTVIAFVSDHDGYKIEFIQKKVNQRRLDFQTNKSPALACRAFSFGEPGLHIATFVRWQ